eukprot:gene9824-2018_t
MYLFPVDSRKAEPNTHVYESTEEYAVSVRKDYAVDADRFVGTRRRSPALLPPTLAAPPRLLLIHYCFDFEFPAAGQSTTRTYSSTAPCLSTVPDAHIFRKLLMPSQ